MSSEDKITVVVRPTTRGQSERFAVSVGPAAPVSELKAIIAEHSSLTADEQRLIFKGKILKDEKSLGEYEIVDNSVVHMVKGRAPGSIQSEAQQAPAPPGPASSGLGMDGIQGAAMRMMADNPELMRTMMQNNPMFTRLVEANPQFAEVLNNPIVLADTMRAMSNPDLMREQMRTNDVALRNIETMPGGYNQLRSMFESMNDALSTSQTSQGSSPLADVFGSMSIAGSGGANVGSSDSTERNSDSQQTGINETPLPNPWAQPQPGASATSPPGLAEMQQGAPAQSGMSQHVMQQMLSNPEMRRSVATMMSNPAMLDLMAHSNPAMRQMMDANPAMRSMMTNPEMMQQMLRPEVMQSVMQMMGGSAAVGATGAGVPDMSAVTRMLAPGAGADGSMPGGQGAPAAGAAAPDMSALLSMLGGAPSASPGAGGTGSSNVPDLSALMGASGGGAGGAHPDLSGLMAMLQGANASAPAPVANPEEAYAAQLQQLKDMGFFDQQENIAALQATNGNVNAAVERLLA